MLSRCKPDRAPKCARCISFHPTASLLAPSHRRRDVSVKSDDGVWKSTPKRLQLTPMEWSSRRGNYLSLGQARRYSTEATTSKNVPPNPDEPESLFNSSQSAWDHVFDNIDSMPPLESVPSAVPRPRKRTQETTASPVTNARRQSMTAREVDAFNNMFNMIFNAVAEQRGRNGKGPGAGANGMRGGAAGAMAAGRQDPLTGAGIGSGPDGSSAMGDLFGKLRRHSRKYKWSAAEDAELERKKEEIELCDTDQQLLEWAMREVFEESARYEDAARQAVARAESASTPRVSSPDSESVIASADAKADGEPLTGTSTNKGTAASPLPLQPPAYPHLLADLMRTFRDKFHDPHLALSIFEHARTRSIASYVFGCTTQAYNELLRTRWACFRDLRGVADALAEMRVNGIAPDARTRALVEELRREVGARTVWQEERSVGTGEVFEMLNRIEQLSAKDKPKSGAGAKAKAATTAKSKRWHSSAERWKTDDAPRKNDTWKFGEWDLKPKNKTNRRQQQQPTPSAGPPQSEWTQELAFE